MKRFARNSVMLIAPFLLMVIINEIVRPTIDQQPYSKYGITAMNSDHTISNKCTWNCQNDTGFCKANHVKYFKPYFKFSDALYFGMIGMLKKTGEYALANIILLVVLAPLMIWFFIIKSWNIQDEINKLKSSHG